jgi:hypothetical protein
MHPPGGGSPGAPGCLVGVVDVLGLVDVLGVVALSDVVDVLGVVELVEFVAALLAPALTTVAPSAPPSIEPATSRASVPRLRFVM